MVYQTRGIILHRFMHADNKMIVKIYTELYGMNAYLCFRTSKKNNNLFLPMSLVDVVAEKKNKGHFAYVKEVKTLSNIHLGEYDVVKSSICMFLNEILYKLLFDAGEDKSLFEFLFLSLNQFFTQTFTPDFHLRFLTNLIRELGASPENNYSQEMIFSPEKSLFLYDVSAKKEEKMLGYYFHCLLKQGLFTENQTEIIPYIYRNQLLDIILDYYSLHIIDLSQIKSHEILKTVLHG
jgi:DNA repair protein RecO (recombination protein O)